MTLFQIVVLSILLIIVVIGYCFLVILPHVLPLWLKRGKRGISGLVDALDHKNRYVRFVVMEHLQKITKKGDIKPLIEAGGIPALLNALKYETNPQKNDAQNACSLIETLKEIIKRGELKAVTDAGGVLVLVDLLKSDMRDGWWDVKTEVKWALLSIIEKGGANDIVLAGGVEDLITNHRDWESKSEYILHELVMKGEERIVISSLLKSLDCGDSTTREDSVWCLGGIIKEKEMESKIDKNEIASQIMSLLEDPCEDVRIAVTRVVGNLASLSQWRPTVNETGMSSLIERLGDSSPSVRYFASVALGNIGNRRVLPELKKLLNDQSEASFLDQVDKKIKEKKGTIAVAAREAIEKIEKMV